MLVLKDGTPLPSLHFPIIPEVYCQSFPSQNPPLGTIIQFFQLPVQHVSSGKLCTAGGQEAGGPVLCGWSRTVQEAALFLFYDWFSFVQGLGKGQVVIISLALGKILGASQMFHRCLLK